MNFISQILTGPRLEVNTSTEVLGGDFSEQNVIHELEEDNQQEEDVISAVEVVDIRTDVIDDNMDGQELFQDEEADNYVQRFSPVLDVDGGDRYYRR